MHLTGAWAAVEHGEITAADAFEATDPDAYGVVLRHWIESAWQAWAAHHELAHALITRAHSG